MKKEDAPKSRVENAPLVLVVEDEPPVRRFLVAGLEAQSYRVVEAETGRRPDLSTSGGTSDARFVKDHCPVVEFGLVSRTLHSVDERVEVAQIGALKAIYGRILRDYFA